MIVSSSSHLHHRVGGGGGGAGLDDRRATSRCSLEMLGSGGGEVTVVPSASSSSSSGTSSTVTKLTSSSSSCVMQSHAPPLAALSSLSPSTSTSTEDYEYEEDEEEDDDDLSSPASSGYGRSTTSESGEFAQNSVRFNLNAGSSSCSSDPAARKAGGSDGDGMQLQQKWSSQSMPRHPFLSAIVRFFPLDDIDDLGSLGEGFFSVVDKVRIRSTAEVLVRKVAKPGVRGERRETHADVAREAKMLRRLEHENVLALRGMSIVQSDRGAWDLHLFLDYCEGGSLSRLLLDHTMALPWRHRFSYAVDIARGMEHIHARRVIHRDLTSMNVLIQYGSAFPPGGRAVIADFGLSCDFPRDGEKLSQVGTTYFMSPECLKEQHYDEKSDVFSFGIILCQLIARIDADPEIGLHRTVDFGLNYRLFITYCPTDTRMELLQVAFGCCLINPSMRLSFAESRPQLERVLAAMNKQAAAMHNNVYPDELSPGRLERSRSDAALRRPRPAPIHQRKYSAYHRPTVKPVTEGLAEEAAALDAEFLDRLPTAAEAATGRPLQLQGAALCMATPRRAAALPSPLNPFSTHARFRSARKIVPSREEERDRRQSERQREEEGEEEMDGGAARRRRAGRLLRRCSSLPSEMDSPQSLEWSDDDDEDDLSDDSEDDGVGGGGMTSSTSMGGGASTTTTVDTLAKVFTELDHKFLRSSRRFSTRRATLAAAAAAAITPTAASAATTTTSSSSMQTLSMMQSSPSLSSSSVVASTVMMSPPPSSSLDSSASPPTRLSLSLTPETTGVRSTSVSYSPATGDRLNNNGDAAAAAGEGAELGGGGLMLPTKYSSWPKRRESRIVRQEEASASFSAGLCRSRNATAARAGKAACSIL